MKKDRNIDPLHGIWTPIDRGAAFSNRHIDHSASRIEWTTGHAAGTIQELLKSVMLGGMGTLPELNLMIGLLVIDLLSPMIV